MDINELLTQVTMSSIFNCGATVHTPLANTFAQDYLSRTRHSKDSCRSSPKVPPILSSDDFCSKARENFESDENSMALRMKDEVWRTFIFGKAATLFEQIRDNEANLIRCCDHEWAHSKCRELFQKTKLRIILGLGPNSILGRTGTVDNGSQEKSLQIVASEAILLRCKDEACIERLLLHELGHACESSAVQQDDSKISLGSLTIPNRSQLDQLYFDCKRGTNTIGETETANLFKGSLMGGQIPKEVALCLYEVTKANGGCMGARAQEIFADAIFASHWTTFEHFTWNCTHDEDSLHLSPKKYFQCIQKDPEFRKNFCNPMN
jgi:hypothetical protein